MRPIRIGAYVVTLRAGMFGLSYECRREADGLWVASGGGQATRAEVRKACKLAIEKREAKK